MNCQEAAELIAAYFDGELDARSAVAFERHLAGCPVCAERLAAHQSLRDSIAAAGPALRFEPSPAQIERLRSTLRISSPPRPAPPPAQPRPLRAWLAAAAVVAIAAGSWSLGRYWPAAGMAPAGIAPAGMAPAGEASLADQAVGDHARALLAGHATDVTSSDRHTVKPWFAGRLDYSPFVVDLAPYGFPLAGGRLDYLDHRPVAALVYRAGRHAITVFTWPDEAATRTAPSTVAGSAPSGLRETELRGYHLVHWHRAGMTFWAVSDAAPDPLRAFALRLDREAGGAS